MSACPVCSCSLNVSSYKAYECCGANMYNIVMLLLLLHGYNSNDTSIVCQLFSGR